MKLYFAYGSNLHKAQMRSSTPALPDRTGEYLNRCPDSHEIAPYILEGYRLAFVGEASRRWGRGGVATIIKSPDDCVLGAIYSISHDDETTLDRLEGFNPLNPPTGRYVKVASLFKYNDQPVMAYIASEQTSENKPNIKYLNTIRAGLIAWGYSVEILAEMDAYPAEEDGSVTP